MATRGVNKVILVGYLGQDPEVRYLPSGGAVANFTLATSETWRDKQDGQMRENTEWHRVVVFGKLAEVAGEYLRKVKVLRSISKVSYVAASGLINLVWRSTLQKLWLTLGAPCRCWAAAVKVSLNLIRKRHLLPPPVQRKGKVRLQVKNLTLLRSNHLRSLIRVTILTMRSPFDDAEKPLMQGLLQEKNHDRQHEHIT